MRLKLKPLRAQVMVVTGASSGIGLATARKAAEAGAAVLLVARNETALREEVARLTEAGHRADFAVADVGELAQVEAAAAKAVVAFGRIDTWVNNAGVAIYADLMATPRDEHERLFRTNYWGAVNGAEAAVPHLARSGGALVTVGSMASEVGTPVMGAYAASKHAVKGYIDSLRIELNRDRVPVSVTLIKPAGIGTPLNEHVINHLGGLAKIPPPVYAPELVADAILRAAHRPVRERTVGGAAEAQILIANHFPNLFAKTAGAATAILTDNDDSQPPTANLFGPPPGGRTRGEQPSRRFSIHAVLVDHPLTATLGVAAVAASALGATRRER